MNRKFNVLKAIVLMAIAFVAFSCGDDGDDKNSPSRTALITGTTWKFSSLDFHVDGMTDEELESFETLFAIFYNGTEYSFKTDNTYTLNWAGTTIDGTWEFGDAEKKLILDKDSNESTTYEIEALSSDKLTLKGDESDGVITLQFVKK